MGTKTLKFLISWPICLQPCLPFRSETSLPIIYPDPLSAFLSLRPFSPLKHEASITKQTRNIPVMESL